MYQMVHLRHGHFWSCGHWREDPCIRWSILGMGTSGLVDIGERIRVSDGPSLGMGTSGLVDIGERIRVSDGPS